MWGGGEGSGWGRRLGLLLMLLLLPPEALPRPGSWCPRVGRLLSLSIQSAPWEKRRSAREGWSGSRQGELAAWSHFPVASSPPPPPSLPSQAGHAGLAWSRRVPSQLSCYLSPATESKGPQHFDPAGNLHVICIHLHFPPFQRPSVVKGCEMK